MLLLELIQWILIFYYIYQLAEALDSVCKTVDSIQERLMAVEEDLPRRRRRRRQEEPEQEPTPEPLYDIPDVVMRTLRDEDTLSNCTICTDPLESNLTVTHCGHVFHSACIQSWLHTTDQSRASCPICRESLQQQRRRRRRRRRRRELEDDQDPLEMMVQADPGSIDIMAFLPGNRILNTGQLSELFNSFL